MVWWPTSPVCPGLRSLAGCKIFSAKIQDSPSKAGMVGHQGLDRAESKFWLFPLPALCTWTNYQICWAFPPLICKIGFKNPILESYYEDPQMHIPRILGTVQQYFGSIFINVFLSQCWGWIIRHKTQNDLKRPLGLMKNFKVLVLERQF